MTKENKSWRRFLEETKLFINRRCNCVDRGETSVPLSQVQKFMKEQGLDPGNVSGDCDEKTRTAIATFQRKESIQIDGCVGDETYGKMVELGFIDPRGPVKHRNSEVKPVEPSKIKKKSIIDNNTFFIGPAETRESIVNLHFSGLGESPDSVANSILSRFKNFIVTRGDVIVTSFESGNFDSINKYIKDKGYRATRIIGFSRGARPPGGAWDYANKFGKSSDELVLLDPSVNSSMSSGTNLPSVGEISMFYGSDHMGEKYNFRPQWEALKSKLESSGNKGNIVDTPSSGGFEAHMRYFNKYYGTSGGILRRVSVSSRPQATLGQNITRPFELVSATQYEENRVKIRDYGSLQKMKLTNLLEEVPSMPGRVAYLHKLAAARFRALVDAASAAGFEGVGLNNGYRRHRWKSRDHYEQKMIEKYGSVSAGRKWVAYDSPHETGLAMDFGTHGLYPISKTVEKQFQTPFFSWLRANAHLYGISPYKNEPWHWEVKIPYDAWLTGEEFTNDYAVKVIDLPPGSVS